MKVHHIAMTVRNLDVSVNFYVDLFGFEVNKKFKREDMGGLAVFLKNKDFYIELWQFDNVINNKDLLDNIKIIGLRHIAFEVKNLESELQNLKQKRIEFSKPQLGASGHRYSFISDPDGIMIELYEK
jgi:glyoxylase I family protein